MNHRLTITAAIATLAASLSLVPLLSGGKWFFGGLGAIIVVAAVGTATRHRALRALPAVVCLLCALVALVLYLNLVYSSKASLGGIIPTPHSLTLLWQSAVHGLRQTQSVSPPVPPIPGIELLASGGIGLVAALTDLIAVRLRRCALAGLPLLVLFSVPVASNASKNTTENVVFFCIGIAGYLALLSADGRERLRLWGRLVTPWNAANPNEAAEEFGAGPSSRALASSGRRIGVAAVVLALFVPLLIPGLHARKLLPGHGTGTGTGHGTGGGTAGSTTVNPMVQMTDGLRLGKPSVVFTYHTNDPHPQYLTEFVLNKMTATGASWEAPTAKTMEPVSGGQALPPIPGYTAGDGLVVTTTVHLEADAALGATYLPVPYAAREVENPLPDSGLTVNPATLMIYSQLSSLNGITYTVKSYDLDPTPEQWAAASARPTGEDSYLTVPAPLRSLRSLAQQIVGNAATPYAKAQALQYYFKSSGKFSYDVDAVEPDNASALRDFLLYSKTGYCQQFSFAMTVLARLLGIPARVAVGYDVGSPIKGRGNYQVETTDEHAWTELYFSGLGWTEWDATPGGSAPGQTNVGPPTYTIKGASGGSNVTGPGSTGGSSSRSTPGSLLQRDGLLGGGGFRDGGLGARKLDNAAGASYGGPVAGSASSGSSLPILLIVLAALAVIGLAAPRTVRSWTRRRRWATVHDEAGRAHAAWAELLDDLTDYGLGHGPGETPRALARRIELQQKLAREAAEALTRLARAEERASYARAPEPAATLPRDVVTVRMAVAAEATRSARWGARLLPPSAVETLRHVLAHALDAFGWLEVAIARLARRLGRTRAEQT